MKEKLVAIGEVEWEALGGLSHLQFRLYMVLRWFMDRQSGTVGLIGRISYQKLRENLEVHRIPGRRADIAGAPTLQEMRSALSGLVNAGLLEPHGSGDLLVFLLPKRVRISARSKEQQQGSNRGQQHDQQHDQSHEQQGFQHQQQHEQQQGSNHEQQHTSRVKVNPLYTPEVVGSLRARETAAPQPEAASVSRVGLICRELRQQGIEAAPHLFAHPDWQELMSRFSDEDILGAVAIAKLRLPSNARIHLNYLKPILTSPPDSAGKQSRADQRAEFFNQLGVGNGARRQNERVVDAEARRVD